MRSGAVLPAAGRPASDVLEEIATLRADDLDWRSGRAFSLVYHHDDEELEKLLHRVALDFLHENALNPFKYRTLMKMEADVVAMAADLFGTSPRAGSMTSGGTESIFLATQTARSHGRSKGIARGNVVIPETAHPAFAKACHYLDIELRRVPIGPDLRADVAATAEAIDEDTLMIVGSAPCYPFGVIDPIEDLAALAIAEDVLCHVDACLGGWLLPFWEELGRPLPSWDFSVEGVTSMSADIHKYAYCFKGASVVLYRDRELLEHQYFMYADWPGGLYASATSAGTRPAPPIAGAWTVLNHLGRDGFLAKARVVMEATDRIRAGIDAIEGVHVTGEPDISVFEINSDVHDINAIGDVMDDRGWNLDRQGGLHLMLSPGHIHVVDEFLSDLAEAVADHGEARDPMAQYGGTAV